MAAKHGDGPFAQTHGGFRPIGLFRALYRVWAAARSARAKEWMQKLAGHCPVFTTLPKRRAVDALWRAQVRNKAGQARYEHALEANWDIAKRSENVSRPLLWREAKRLGYPLAVLRFP